MSVLHVKANMHCATQQRFAEEQFYTVFVILQNTSNDGIDAYGSYFGCSFQ